MITWFNNVYCVFLIMSETHERIGNGSPLKERIEQEIAWFNQRYAEEGRMPLSVEEELNIVSWITKNQEVGI